MKPQIYLAHSSNYDFQGGLYKPIKSSHLMSMYEFIFLLDKPDNLPNTKELVKSYSAVIAEMSYPSTGAGIEIGWADALRIPIIFIHNELYNPPPYLKTMSPHIIKYDKSTEIPLLLEPVLKRII